MGTGASDPPAVKPSIERKELGVHIRPAKMQDARLLFNWRNDPATRAMSITSGELNWEMHLGWLSSRLSLPDPCIFITEVSGCAIGTFRIDGDEISFTVAPEARGRGHATEMLRLAREMFGSKIAVVKPENQASAVAARGAGHRVRFLVD